MVTEGPLPMTLDEAVREAEAIVADRSAPELQRRAMEVLIRFARRARRSSSSQIEAVQHFARSRELLADAAREAEAGLDAVVTRDD